MDPDDWSEIIGLLTARESGGGAVETIETHISTILLVGAHAYKFKKPVQLPFVDLRAVGMRLECCQRELRLNRRTAPELYIAVRRFTRGAGGAIEMDGDGDLVDCCVEMHRFDKTALLSLLAPEDFTRPLIDALARQVVELHESAEISARCDGAERLWAVIELLRRGLADCDLFSRADIEDLLGRLRSEWERCRVLLDDRSARGKVRRGHGDLHLANICLIDGQPKLFDCLEFDEELATVDILYDLAFLLMDLWRSGAEDAANYLFNRYLDELDETDGLALLPLFMALRAAIRAQVLAVQFGRSQAPREEIKKRACDYLKLADMLLRPSAPRLVAIGGLSGSGKSTLARALAPRIGSPPGARILSSDRIRKQRFAVRPEQRLPQSAYDPGVSQAVYETLISQAEATLRHGWSAVADAVFDRPADQSAIKASAERIGAPFVGIWLEAPTETLVERVAARKNDVSDATVDVVLQQATKPRSQSPWHHLSASDGEGCQAAALRLLKLA